MSTYILFGYLCCVSRFHFFLVSLFLRELHLLLSIWYLGELEGIFSLLILMKGDLHCCSACWMTVMTFTLCMINCSCAFSSDGLGKPVISFSYPFSVTGCLIKILYFTCAGLLCVHSDVEWHIQMLLMIVSSSSLIECIWVVSVIYLLLWPAL